MRVDVVSIFPDYLRALDLSLPGRAQQRGILDLRVHDLRRWTHDRHRTVDDTPYGGGAGMVMRPEPWGEALDALLGEAGASPVLVVPTPAGRPFTQAMAAELAGEEHLVLACGRYEGIDQRVMDHAASQVRVLEVSVGDYVLNGGEAAALVLLEAVVRLLPGVLGNAASLHEESHTIPGLLEHPVFTKPASWRGLDVPAVLLSGDHARIEAWRRAQARRRTAERRPDLLHTSQAVSVEGGGPEPGEWRLGRPADAGELFTLMRACWLDVALEHGDWRIPPLLETYDDVVAGLGTHLTFVLRVGGRLVASGRGRRGDGSVGGHESAANDEWHISRLMVAPDLRGRGVGRWVLEQLEAAAPPEATAYALVTGPRSVANLRRYRRAGYAPDRQGSTPDFVRLVKPRTAQPG